jgi:glycosyltransferase involved in cell wall biosynthesis
MNKPNIFFYNDSSIVGGHEIMTARIINTLARDQGYTIHFAFHAQELHQHLHSDIITYSLPFHSKSRSCRHNGLFDISYIRSLIRKSAARLVIVSQGYIESGVRGIVAARLENCYTGSYIPFGNTNRELRSRYAGLRDLLTRPVYALNQFYITISPYQQRMLARLTGTQPLHIINNPVTDQPLQPIAPVPLQPPTAATPLQVAIIGRINFKQKNQNCLPELATLCRAHNFPVVFHVVGDGPDRAALETQISASATQAMFRLHGWLSAPQLQQLLTQSIQAVLMPSHYEGLPLALLEAICAGKPVIMSDLDLLDDYPLPAACKFDPRNIASIYRALTELPRQDTVRDISALQSHIAATNSYPRFQRDTASCFAELLQHSA